MEAKAGLHAVVVGGSIAGVASALKLVQAGCTVSVFLGGILQQSIVSVCKMSWFLTWSIKPWFPSAGTGLTSMLSETPAQTC